MTEQSQPQKQTVNNKKMKNRIFKKAIQKKKQQQNNNSNNNTQEKPVQEQKQNEQQSKKQVVNGNKQQQQKKQFKGKKQNHGQKNNNKQQQNQNKNKQENDNELVEEEQNNQQEQQQEGEQMTKTQKRKLKKQAKQQKELEEKQAMEVTPEMYKKAEKLYLEDAQKALKKYKIGKSDENWMKKIMTSGTLKDRISAIQIYVKDNPKYTLPSLDNLLKICEDKNKKEALVAFSCLKDLFLTCIIGDLRLNTFNKNIQLMKGKHTDKHLIDFYYEGRIKDIYMKYLQLLVKGLSDPLHFYRKQVIEILFELLSHKLEQEEFIISTLVNKFGDSDKNLVTIINKKLSLLLVQKSRLLEGTVKELQRFILRKNVSMNAQFYAINFMNCLNFKQIEADLIMEVINFLFTLFSRILDNDNDELFASKLLSQILRGVNKLFPITKQNFGEYKQFYQEKIDELFRLVNVAKNFKIRVQTLLFIFQVQSHNNSLSERYFRVLYELMQSPELTHTSMNELVFDILYYSLKADFDIGRIKAFLKRLLQASMHADNAFTITALLFVQKIFKCHPQLATALSHNEKFYLEEDDEEHFKDQAESDDEENDEQQDQNNEDKQQENSNTLKNYYDPYKREPLYANAQESGLWELNTLARHNHPTVSKFAQDILQGKQIIYKSNALIDFTLANFLDRFSLRKSKKKESKGLRQLKAKGKLRMSKIESELTVSSVLAKNKTNSVRLEERFFVKYFEEKNKKNELLGKNEKKKKKTAEEEEEEMDEFADDLFEQYMEDGDVDEDDDIEEDELDYSYDSQEFEGQQQLENEDGEGEDFDGEDIDMEDDDGEDEQENEEDFESRKQQYEDEFEDDQEFEGLEEDEQFQSDDEGDDEDDFVDLLEKAGHDEVEEIENFKSTRKLNSKQLLEQKRQNKRNNSSGGGVQNKSKKIRKGGGSRGGRRGRGGRGRGGRR